jgi:hypothetical protein
MAFNFLDQLYKKERAPDGLTTTSFVAQFYKAPVSPRSTIMLYQEDGLVPKTSAGDRYRSPEEPPAFEVSFVFPRESAVRLARDLLPLYEKSMSDAQERSARVAAAEGSVASQTATAADVLELNALADKVEELDKKIRKTKKKKTKAKYKKQRAKLINDYETKLIGSSTILLDTRNESHRELNQRWASLGATEGLVVRYFSRADRSAEEQAVMEKERAEGAYRIRKEISEALAQLEAIPALTFTVPPNDVALKMGKIIFDGNMTQQGYQVEHWGEALDQLSVSGQTGAFYSVVGATGLGGLNNQLRRGSRAYQELMALVGIYRNNGYIYHTLGGNAGQVNLPAALVKIQMGQHIFIGRFDTFSISEEEGQPFSLTYQFTFTSFLTYLYGTDTPSSSSSREATPRTSEPEKTIEEGTR